MPFPLIAISRAFYLAADANAALRFRQIDKLCKLCGPAFDAPYLRIASRVPLLLLLNFVFHDGTLSAVSASHAKRVHTKCVRARN